MFSPRLQKTKLFLLSCKEGEKETQYLGCYINADQFYLNGKLQFLAGAKKFIDQFAFYKRTFSFGLAM